MRRSAPCRVTPLLAVAAWSFLWAGCAPASQPGAVDRSQEVVAALHADHCGEALALLDELEQDASTKDECQLLMLRLVALAKCGRAEDVQRGLVELAERCPSEVRVELVARLSSELLASGRRWDKVEALFAAAPALDAGQAAAARDGLRDHFCVMGFEEMAPEELDRLCSRLLGGLCGGFNSRDPRTMPATVSAAAPTRAASVEP